MPNNPYAPEALQRRISGNSQETTLSLPKLQQKAQIQSIAKDNNKESALNDTDRDSGLDIEVKRDYKKR